MCDTVVVVTPDRVLFAKNSDRDANESQALSWHAAAEHPAGATLQCTYLTIPQARRTHAVLLSRPFWMWGAEIGANEHGVTMGNEAVFTRAPYAPTGLTGMDLLRLSLERSVTAEEAVDVLLDLLRTHGQGGGCGHENRSFTYHNSFLVADRKGAFVVETSGRDSVVERVVGARSISNGLTVDGFATAHSDVLKTAVSACRVRQARTQALAQQTTSTAELMALLRDHGDTRYPRYSPVNGAMAMACMHAGGWLTSSQTTASWVAELSVQEDLHWVTATAAPCTSIFKPVRVTQPLDLGPWPSDVRDERCLWWRHERMHRRIMTNPAELMPVMAPQRDATEKQWLAAPPTSRAAFAEADRLLSRWTALVEEEPAREVRPPWARRYWAVREARAR